MQAFDYEMKSLQIGFETVMKLVVFVNCKYSSYPNKLTFTIIFVLFSHGFHLWNWCAFSIESIDFHVNKHIAIIIGANCIQHCNYYLDYSDLMGYLNGK